MKQYNITIEIVYKKDYLVEAESMDQAHTLALEKAIEEHPGADVFVH